MTISLHPDFEVVESESSPSAPSSELANRFDYVPIEYKEFLESYTSLQLFIPSDVNLAIFGPAEILETDEDYEVSRYLPGAFPVGTDFNDGLLFMSEKMTKPGVYRCGYGALDYDEAKFVASSLKGLLERKEGIDVLFGGM